MTKSTTPLSKSTKGALYALTGFSCFSIGDAGFKYMGDFYSVYVVALYASIVTLVIFLAMAVFQKTVPAILGSAYKKEHCLRGLFLCGQFLCIIYAFVHMPLAKAYALVFAAPFITALLAAAVLKEPLSLQKLASIAIGFAGVLVILRPGMIPLETAAIGALMAALMFALSNITVRYIGKKNPDEPLLAYAVYTEIIIVTLCSILAYSDMSVPPLLHMLIFTGIGLMGAIAILCLAKGFVIADAAVAGTFQYIQILWGAGLGYIFFKDVIDIYTLIGAAIVIASGIWMLWHESKADAKMQSLRD